jgi:hypothetical protein
MVTRTEVKIRRSGAVESSTATQFPKQVLRMSQKYKDAATMSDIRKNSKI